MELAIKFFITFTEIALLFPLFVAYRNRAFWPNNLTLKLLAYFLLVSFIQICIVTPHDIINYNGYDSPNTVFYYNWQYVITAYLKLGIYYTLLTSKHKKFLILSFAVILTGFVVAEFRQDSLTFYNTGSFITYHFGSIFVYSFVGNGANTEDATIAWIVNGLLLFILYITISFAYYYSYSPNLTQDS